MASHVSQGNMHKRCTCGPNLLGSLSSGLFWEVYVYLEAHLGAVWHTSTPCYAACAKLLRSDLHSLCWAVTVLLTRPGPFRGKRSRDRKVWREGGGKEAGSVGTRALGESMRPCAQSGIWRGPFA